MWLPVKILWNILASICGKLAAWTPSNGFYTCLAWRKISEMWYSEPLEDNSSHTLVELPKWTMAFIVTLLLCHICWRTGIINAAFSDSVDRCGDEAFYSVFWAFFKYESTTHSNIQTSCLFMVQRRLMLLSSPKHNIMPVHHIKRKKVQSYIRTFTSNTMHINKISV